MARADLPFPVLDALPMGAHRLLALTDEALFAACGVRVMFTGRGGGTSEGAFSSLNCRQGIGDDETAVARNQRIVCEAAGAGDAALVVPLQVHGTDLVRIDGVSDVESALASAREGADALIVGSARVAALLNFADCLPLVIVSPSGRFAVAHAGWRGAVAHIAAKVARELASGDDFGPAQFNAYIGPHIREECFEVGRDVEDRFREEFGDAVVAAGRHVSLAEAVTRDLVGAGLSRQRIADAGICTKCHSDRYFSYRASGGHCGRHAAFAVRIEEDLKPDDPERGGHADGCEGTL